MEPLLRFSKNVLQELEAEVSRNKPLRSTEKGDLFALAALPLGAVRLKISLNEYLAYLDSLPKETRPEPRYIIPYTAKEFHVIIFAHVTARGGKTLVGGRETILL